MKKKKKHNLCVNELGINADENLNNFLQDGNKYAIIVNINDNMYAKFYKQNETDTYIFSIINIDNDQNCATSETHINETYSGLPLKNIESCLKILDNYSTDKGNYTRLTKEQKETFFGIYKTIQKYLLKLKNVPENQDQEARQLIQSIVFKKQNEETFPKWFSLGGALKFDYDYYTEDIDGKNKKYYKINQTTDLPEEVKTRNNNGWIVKDGWIDKVGNFCSKNLCCCCCDCYNDDANIYLNQDIINNYENIQ